MTSADSRRVKVMHLLGKATHKLQKIAKTHKCPQLKDDANALNTMKYMRDYSTMCMAVLTMDPALYDVDEETRSDIKALYDLSVMCLTVEIEGCDVRDDEYGNIEYVARSLGVDGDTGPEQQVIVVLGYSSN